MKKELARAALVAALAPLGLAAQTTWHVDDDACPGPGAGTYVDSFCSIQHAIEEAVDGDLVLVAPGTYAENLDYLGKAITVLASEGPKETVLDPAPAPRPTVRFASGEGRDSVLDGFTVHGFSYLVYCEKSSPTIVRNELVDNTGFTAGVIYCLESEARILSNVIRNNVVFGTGGGITGFYSDLWIAGNEIVQNHCLADPYGNGGGIYLAGCTARIESNLVAENFVRDYGFNQGGGIYADDSGVTIVGSTIAGNVAYPGFFVLPPFFNGYTDGEGGGVWCGGSSRITIRDTILWGDMGTAGASPTMPGTPVVNEIFVAGAPNAGGSVSVYSSDVEGGLAAVVNEGGVVHWGDGNVEVDPGFVDPDASDYHLAPGSPLVDAGPAGVLPRSVDVDGDPRFLDGDRNGNQRVDVGADELDPTELVATGPAVLGGTLSLETHAPPYTFAYLLLASDAPGDLPLPPFGSLLLSLPGLSIVGGGPPPGTDVVPIPPAPALVGQELWFQSLSISLAGVSGSLSNAVRFVVH